MRKQTKKDYDSNTNRDIDTIINIVDSAKKSTAYNIIDNLAKLVAVGLIIGAFGWSFQSNEKLNLIIKQQEQELAQKDIKYNSLMEEHRKTQALVTATTAEIRRLSTELRVHRGNINSSIIIDGTMESFDHMLTVVSDHIRRNEAFSAFPYCDANGRFHNGYGTRAVLHRNKVGAKIRVRGCDGNMTYLVATERNNMLPERNITQEEALRRKTEHIRREIFPHLIGKTFRSDEELIVVVDSFFNRGSQGSRNLFNKDGSVNCQTLLRYMNHSQARFQRVMINRYAQNYALCISGQ